MQRRLLNRARMVPLLLAAVGAAGVPALGATNTWLGGSATDPYWDQGGNWSTGANPTLTDDDVIFPTPIPTTPGAIITLGAAEAANSLVFNDSYSLNTSSSVTPGPSALTLGGASTAASGNVTVAASATVNFNVSLAGSLGLNYNPVSGGGSGTLILNSPGSFSGGVTVNSGILAVNNSTALGSNAVTLNNGTLRLGNGSQAALQAISLHFSVGRSSTEIDNVTGSAGVLPVSGWNNYADTATTGTPGTALTDNNGNSTTATLASYNSTNAYSVYGGSQSTGNANLLNSYLDNSSTSNTDFVTINGIPYSKYSVIAYFGSDTAGRGGHVTIGSTSYYYKTTGSNGAVFAQTTATSSASEPTANYAVFNTQSGASLTVDTFNDSGNNGLFGIEILNLAALNLNIANNVSLSAASTTSAIDVTGVPNASIGALTMNGAPLHVTGGSNNANTAYSLTTGTVSLGGNPTITVANNGTAAGTLNLGAISDGGTARTITLGGAGTVALTAAGNVITTAPGTIVNLNAGTLSMAAAGALGTTAQITVAAGATLGVSASQTLSAVSSSATSSQILLSGGATLTVGNSLDNLSTSFSGIISGAGTLVKAGTGTFTLNTGGSSATAVTVNAGTLSLNASQAGTLNAPSPSTAAALSWSTTPTPSAGPATARPSPSTAAGYSRPPAASPPTPGTSPWPAAPSPVPPRTGPTEVTR
jgi:fibronectin-binding autotransporter adhesin